MSAINYDLSKIKAFVFDVDGVLSPSTIPLESDGMPRRMVNIKDGYALQLAVKHGYPIAIITGGKDSAVYKRFHALGIEDIFMQASDKLPVLENWIALKGLQPEEVAYMGDDIPDLPCMRYVGLPCSPYDGAWEIKETAIFVSRFSGGYGCARDLVEQTMKAHGNWMNGEKAFGW